MKSRRDALNFSSHHGRAGVWWPSWSSKPVGGGNPVVGRFDSYAFPPTF